MFIMVTVQNGKYILKLQIFLNNTIGAKTCHPKGQFATNIDFQSLVNSKKMALPLRRPKFGNPNARIHENVSLG